jgi:hypothetical protein
MHARTSQYLCDILCSSETNNDSKNLLILRLQAMVSEEVSSYPSSFPHKKSIQAVKTNIFSW